MKQLASEHELRLLFCRRAWEMGSVAAPHKGLFQMIEFDHFGNTPHMSFNFKVLPQHTGRLKTLTLPIR